jgi:glycosyltransferase involved in cell wall biosynthesis
MAPWGTIRKIEPSRFDPATAYIALAKVLGSVIAEDITRQRELEDHLRLTGYLGDEDLRMLYSCCRIFIYPSLYEGFGLPPAEAMACGRAVIVSAADDGTVLLWPVPASDNRK